MPRKASAKTVPKKEIEASEEHPVLVRTVSIVALVAVAVLVAWKLGVFSKKTPALAPEYELYQLEASSEPVVTTIEERGAELRALEASSSPVTNVSAKKTDTAEVVPE